MIRDATMKMFVSNLCKVCESKRAKRSCPGVTGEICPSCCGSERENSISCPLDCSYLRDARLHHKPAKLDDQSIPHLDVPLSQGFVERQEPVILYLCFHLSRDMQEAGACDLDVREALETLIQSYRTLQSGLIYEARTANPYAAAVRENLKKAIEELRHTLAAERGMETLRDKDVLGCLVFVQRLELQYNNGRRKSRAFLDFLRSSLPKPTDADAAADPQPRVQLA